MKKLNLIGQRFHKFVVTEDAGGSDWKCVCDIKPFSTYKELRYELSNGRTLCIPCHKKTPTWGNGEKLWR